MKTEVASTSDLAGIRWLLASEHLPIDDLSEQSLESFLVLREGNELLGAIGLEHYAEIALLRSLVVASDQRGRGYGALLPQRIFTPLAVTRVAK